MMLGKGLVKTPEDFGSQGAIPTHPRLLDWLSISFIESGWDTKALIKLIASSSTYRQTSHMSADKLATDPENDLLSHANRYQLPAEMLRDNALLASGLLVDKQGGPPLSLMRWHNHSNRLHTVRVNNFTDEVFIPIGGEQLLPLS